MFAAHESNGVDIEQQRRRAALRRRLGIEDVHAAERQVERLRPGRILVQQEPKVGGRLLCRRQFQEHARPRGLPETNEPRNEQSILTAALDGARARLASNTTQPPCGRAGTVRPPPPAVWASGGSAGPTPAPS